MNNAFRPFARQTRPATPPAHARAAVADPPPPPTPGYVTNLAYLFLRRNLTRIAMVWSLVALALFCASLFLFNKYYGTALIMIDPRTARVVQNQGVLSNIGADSNAIESIVQIAKSDGFIAAIIDQLRLDRDPEYAKKGVTPAIARAAMIEKLRNNLFVNRKGVTYVIEATASSSSADTAAKIASTAAQKIIDDQNELRSGANEKIAKEIQGRLSELRGRVTRAEEAAAELKAKLKVTDVGQNSTLLERRAFELNQQLVLAGAKTAEARARYELLRRAGAGAGDSLPPAIQSSVLNALRAEFARLTRQSADQSTVLGARHPEVVSLNAQITDLRRQIGAEISRMLAAARSDYLEAEQREAALSRNLKGAQDDSGALGPQLVKLGELDREAKAQRAVYEQLLVRQRELEQTKNLEPSDIRVVSAATPPTKTWPGMLILAAGSAVFGLFGGLLYALTREWRSRGVKTSRQIERLSGQEVLALAPLLATPAETQAKTARPPGVFPWLADLCSTLIDAPRRTRGQTILVTSATRGEGRTTIAVNLARYFAQGGQRVLLIEADGAFEAGGRRPFGLIDVLDRGENLPGAIVLHPSDGYAILPFGGRTLGGAAPPTAALMTGVTLRATLKLLRRAFDIIVVDGPPALDAAHGRLLAAQADATAFVVEWNRTSPAQVAEALERLAVLDAALVLNKVDVKRLRLFDPAASRRLEAGSETFARAA
jgi:uncharacterized protein involved in exopolysaccharide biosynthesis/Mrp family chromosome partitioning ATPase